jgi:hypothetical protein
MTESSPEGRPDGANEPAPTPTTTPERWPGTPVHVVPPEEAAEGSYEDQVRKLETEQPAEQK